MKSRLIDLSCAKCGSNRLRFPTADEDRVICEDCGAAGKTLRDLTAMVVEPKPTKLAALAAQRDRQLTEVEASQADIRESIIETDRLVEEAGEMVKRHRKEAEDEASG